MMKKLFVVVLTAAFLLAGCSSSARKAETGAVASDAAYAPVAGAPQASKGQGTEQAKPAPGGSGAELPVIPADRKVILNAELGLKVKDADSALSQIAELVKGAGGYVHETREEGSKQRGRTMYLTLRVPSERYDSVLTKLGELGEGTGRRTWSDDVTAEYFDLDIRIKTREAHLEQLRRLIEKGGTIKELMEVEQEIARVTADLESMKGRYRLLSNQVAYSTIKVTLYEPGAPTPIKPPETVWERMKLGFLESWHGVVNFTGDLAVAIVSALPTLIYLIVVGGGAYLVIRRFRNRGGRGPGQPPAA